MLSLVSSNIIYLLSKVFAATDGFFFFPLAFSKAAWIMLALSLANVSDEPSSNSGAEDPRIGGELSANYIQVFMG